MKNIYPELALINKLVFEPCGMYLSNLEIEAESQEYFAHNFRVDHLRVKFRQAKITPTKTGQFVSIWKRSEKGITTPFEINDSIDCFIILTRKSFNLGLFIFPKNVLYKNGILSDSNKLGKRGIRVYPKWDLTTNKQASKTQLWQSDYFLEILPNKDVDLNRAKFLFNQF